MSNTTHRINLSPADRDLRDHLILRAELFPQGAVMDAKELYLPELWDALPEGAGRPLGRQISSLVRRGLLPLEPAGFDSSRHNLYRRV